MIGIKLSKEAVKALNDWNRKQCGRGASGDPIITNPETIKRLQNLALPGESLSDAIVRLCHQGGALPQ